MEILNNISEYYDELFPVLDGQKKFFEEITAEYNKPVKYLSVNCGTGLFEHGLATDGWNVTAIESILPFIESANRRRRTQLMMFNVFQMTTLEMGRFLGKGFFNVISILDNRLIFIHDKVLLEKFFFDCKQLLSENGKIVISIPNFEEIDSKTVELPTRESIRVKLFTKVKTNPENEKILEQNLETGSGKLLSVTSDAKIIPLTKSDIEEYAKKIGFKKIDFYSDFLKTDFNSESKKLICVISF